MRTVLIIAERELAAYFATPVASVFIVIFLVLQGALYEARKRNSVVRKEGLELKHDGRTRKFNLEITPLKIPDSTMRCYLVLFEESQAEPAPAPPSAAERTGRSRSAPMASRSR